MAANYWESTQRRHWQFTKDQLAAMRQTLEETDPSLVLMYPLPSPRHLAIFFNQQISRLGKRLGVRQQAMATAQVYIKRFYTRVEIRRTNPYLVVATSVYLACKMEECPQHIRLMVTEARSLWPDFLSFTDTSKLGECEFFLISEMHSQLIVHQPYRTLATQQTELGLSTDEARMAWDIINDHYMTDLPLLYPPHIVALTAILLALVFRTGATPGVAASNMAAATAALTQAGSRMGPGGIGVGSEQQSQSQLQLQQQQQQLGKDAAAVAAGPGSPAAGGRAGKVHKLAQWLAESNVDIEAMIDCTQELIAFYECQEQYNDKDTREQINRFVKARSLNK